MDLIKSQNNHPVFNLSRCLIGIAMLYVYMFIKVNVLCVCKIPTIVFVYIDSQYSYSRMTQTYDVTANYSGFYLQNDK